MGGEKASRSPHGLTVLNLGLSETMYTLWLERREPVERAIRTGTPSVSVGNNSADPSRTVASTIIVVVIFS